MTRDTSMNDETKCPACGGEMLHDVDGHYYHCQACNKDWTLEALLCQLTAKTAECEEAQAACAAMRDSLAELVAIFDGGEQVFLRAKSILQLTAPGKPILDELARLRTQNADLMAACKKAEVALTSALGVIRRARDTHQTQTTEALIAVRAAIAKAEGSKQ